VKNFALIVLSMALVGCPDEPRNDAVVYVAKACEPATPESHRKVFTKYAALGSQHPNPRLCIDQHSDRVDFSPNSLRIKIYQRDLVGLRLDCSDEVAARRFYERHNFKEVALVAGDTIAGFYTSLAPNGTVQCGEMTFTDPEAAIKLCEVIAKSWSVDQSSCVSVCTSSQDRGKDGVCVLSNAT